MATNMYRPKWPTNMYKPKWQQICTSPNGPQMYKPKWPSNKHNNNNMPALQWPKWQPHIDIRPHSPTHPPFPPLIEINKFKPEASTELWEQQLS